MGAYGLDGLDELDAVSTEFAHALLHGNPVLARYARREQRPGGGSYFVLEVPSPSGEHGPLVVDTGDRERIAVRWGRFSAEFDAPAEGGRFSELPGAVSLVEDLLEGQRRAYVCERDGRYRGSGTVVDSDELESEFARHAPGTVLTVLEWDRPPVRLSVPAR